ncbi:MAG: hypothetical protein AABZ52_03860, partial [Nitrospirota bacterium]
LQPRQLRHLLNFLLGNLHSLVPFLLSKDVQNHHPARPQARTKPQAYPPGYVEDFVEPRTMLGMIFNILLFHSHTFG